MSYLNELKNLGLKENEAKVYLAGLRFKNAKISEISKQTKLKRANVYAIIEKLIEKGLFKIKIINFKKYYIAEPPEKLKDIVNQNLERIVNNLKINAGGKQNINLNQILYYKGVNGMKTAYSSMLEDLKPRDFYYVFGESARWLETDKQFFLKFIRKRAKLNLNLKLILTNTKEALFFKKFAKNFNQKVKILPSETKLNMNLAITPHKILMHQLANPRTTIIIESPAASQMQKQMFEIMWKAL